MSSRGRAIRPLAPISLSTTYDGIVFRKFPEGSFRDYRTPLGFTEIPAGLIKWNFPNSSDVYWLTRIRLWLRRALKNLSLRRVRVKQIIDRGY